MKAPNIAIIGATGAVGRVFLDIITERGFPTSSIRLCASERSWGKTLSVANKAVIVEEATPQLLHEVDIVFIAAGSEISSKLAPVAVEQGAFVIDKSSAFRMDPDVPLVVPEVNSSDLSEHKGIVASPNCSTAPLVMVIKPLNDIVAITRVITDTYQSVSGAGSLAMKELLDQSENITSKRPINAIELPHQIAFNIIPHIEGFLENGFTNEEMKMVEESRKILHLPDLSITATCVRVPVLIGHSEAVHIEFTEAISPGLIREILAAAPGIQVRDDPNANEYPMPIDAADKDEVLAGRIRQDPANPKQISMWLSCDNLRKGAALNAIQIAEEMLQRNIPLNHRRI
ncbi:aspartate-semialdehyde dehydrogenase [Dehalococcoidia bacterium]|nr:aspartate-semialdehyde dehydrogenase [Dehalococcoidia bacterium]